VGDDLGQVGGGADAGGGRADVGDRVDGAVGGVAGGRVAHSLDRDREADVEVERGVAVDDDVPAGCADVQAAIAIVSRATATSPVDSTQLSGMPRASARSRSDGPKLIAP
jgi:hypothetical protein